MLNAESVADDLANQSKVNRLDYIQTVEISNIFSPQLMGSMTNISRSQIFLNVTAHPTIIRLTEF